VEINNLESSINTKQNMIDTNEKSPIDNADLGSSVCLIEMSRNSQAPSTNINNAISTLEGLQQGDLTSFQTIQDTFDTLETSVDSKQNIIDTENDYCHRMSIIQRAHCALSIQYRVIHKTIRQWNKLIHSINITY
jgi:hypothetical protein